MMQIINTPLFGIILSIVTFEIGLFISRKIKNEIFNPLLISMILSIAFLLKFNISFEVFNIGGSFISFFLTPATVILAVPLYKKFDIFKSNALPILVGIVVGSFTAIMSVVVLSRLFGVSSDILLSLMPKSITTPIGIELSNKVGGMPSLTATGIAITGIFGAIVSPWVCRVFRINDKVAKGIAIGTSSHALGTTKAIEMGEVEGAMSGVAIGLAGIATVILIPIILIFI
ncbi:LrgB family protein [Clostridium sp. DL1XJH146]